jgi:hypothetical protein
MNNKMHACISLYVYPYASETKSITDHATPSADTLVENAGKEEKFKNSSSRCQCVTSV